MQVQFANKIFDWMVHGFRISCAVIRHVSADLNKSLRDQDLNQKEVYKLGRD